VAKVREAAFEKVFQRENAAAERVSTVQTGFSYAILCTTKMHDYFCAAFHGRKPA
jgi:hypothetical protein